MKIKKQRSHFLEVHNAELVQEMLKPETMAPLKQIIIIKIEQ